ncbi:MAG: hypothetical protein IPO97_07720 [Sphingomonadales bacterium]|nr:hypothetical protein [Sphingomonadales bacterium]
MRYWLALVGALFFAGAAYAQVSPQEVAAAHRGIVTEQGRDAAWHYAQHRLLGGAINALKPQRPGVVDACVIVAGLDLDPVFGREARADCQGPCPALRCRRPDDRSGGRQWRGRCDDSRWFSGEP